MNTIITHPASDDNAEIALLWQQIFHDSDAFVNLFFQRVYKPVNALVVKRNSRIVAVLHLIPYYIKVGDAIIPSAYICGVCTHPSERGQGLMTRLMNAATIEMQRRNYGIATLIPAEKGLFDCYRKRGYIYPANRRMERINKTNLRSSYTVPRLHFTPCTDAHFQYFDRKQRERQCAVLHDAYDFQTILDDLTFSGGHAWTALEANQPVGIMFIQPQTTRIARAVVVNEIYYDSHDVKEAFTRRLFETYNAQTVEIYAPVTSSDDTGVCSYGLARILDKNIHSLDGLYLSLMLDS